MCARIAAVTSACAPHDGDVRSWPQSTSRYVYLTSRMRPYTCHRDVIVSMFGPFAQGNMPRDARRISSSDLPSSIAVSLTRGTVAQTARIAPSCIRVSHFSAGTSRSAFRLPCGRAAKGTVSARRGRYTHRRRPTAVPCRRGDEHDPHSRPRTCRCRRGGTHALPISRPRSSAAGAAHAPCGAEVLGALCVVVVAEDRGVLRAADVERGHGHGTGRRAGRGAVVGRAAVRGAQRGGCVSACQDETMRRVEPGGARGAAAMRSGSDLSWRHIQSVMNEVDGARRVAAVRPRTELSRRRAKSK